MGMAATKTPDRWTVDLVRALPDDGRRYEIVDGELLVTPSPSYRHQNAVLALGGRLREYLAAHAAGHVLIAPADVVFEQRTLVQPDVVVLPLAHGRAPERRDQAGTPMLTIEILSPASGAAEAFALGLAEFFREVLGD
jgi:Uma2 family endonuclease